MHSDWFNGIEILQGRLQHGEKVGYCYPSGLEKTLCKWDIYVPLVTKGVTPRWSTRIASVDVIISDLRLRCVVWNLHFVGTRLQVLMPFDRGRCVYIALVCVHCSGVCTLLCCKRILIQFCIANTFLPRTKHLLQNWLFAYFWISMMMKTHVVGFWDMILYCLEGALQTAACFLQ